LYGDESKLALAITQVCLAAPSVVTCEGCKATYLRTPHEMGTSRTFFRR